MFRRLCALATLALTLLSLGCGAPSTNATPNAPAKSAPSAPPNFGERAPGEPETALPVELDDVQVGSPNAKVTIVAFLDFECQFCQLGFAALLELQKSYPAEDLRIVLKHMPLDFHPNALPAAVAAQAVQLGAGSAAAFEFSALAFSNPAAITYQALADWADSVGLPRERYNELVSDELTVKRVASDVLQGRRLGVSGTPAFFVNGKMLVGAQPLEAFRSLVDAEKREMDALLGSRSWSEAFAARMQKNTEESLADALLARDPDDYRVPLDGSPAHGPADALVTVVLFTDFECPYCKRVVPTLRELEKAYAGQVRWVFKHKPLPFHARARPASLVAAALFEKKGAAAFFAAEAELFESSADLSDELLLAVGTRHGLTIEEVNAALSGQNAAANRRLERDDELADDVEVEGTPHFFVNGKRLSGARPAAHFRALIDHQKKRAEALVASGTPASGVYDALQKEALSPGAPQKVASMPSEKNQPTRGSDKAPVAIHIWSDFECPFCRQAELVLAELDRKFPGQLRFVWHDMPLDFHPKALPAARAAREAFRQKGSAGFWKMHDLLFGLERASAELGREQILDHGRVAGLDLARLTSALDDTSTHPGIAADESAAEALGIRGTPAFVVGGYLLTGARPAAHFERLIRLALAESAATPPAAATPTPPKPTR